MPTFRLKVRHVNNPRSEGSRVEIAHFLAELDVQATPYFANVLERSIHLICVSNEYVCTWRWMQVMAKPPASSSRVNATHSLKTELQQTPSVSLGEHKPPLLWLLPKQTWNFHERPQFDIILSYGDYIEMCLWLTAAAVDGCGCRKYYLLRKASCAMTSIARYFQRL